MSEKVATVVLHINPILLRDAKIMAQSLDIEPDRFLTELLESQVATWRMKKQIPPAKPTKKTKILSTTRRPKRARIKLIPKEESSEKSNHAIY